MNNNECPRCKKPLEGQVKLCSLCGSAYHAQCLRDTRDCVFCATRTPKAGGDGVDKKKSNGVYILALLLFIVATLLVLAIGKITPRPNKGEQASLNNKVARVRQDLDLIRQACVLFEDREGKALRGVDMTPLIPDFLPKVPKDPWGREYRLDGNIGVVVSFGKDGTPGGAEENTDIYRYFRRPLHIVAAHYSEEMKTRILQVVFNKGFDLMDPKGLIKQFQLIEQDQVIALLPEHWTIASACEYHDPDKAMLALRPASKKLKPHFLASIVPGKTAIRFAPEKGTRKIVAKAAEPSDGIQSPCLEAPELIRAAQATDSTREIIVKGSLRAGS